MISAIFSRINENWTNRLFALVICWFVFGLCYIAVQEYKTAKARTELKSFVVPISCDVYSPNNDYSVFVKEKGKNQTGIRDMEKQLLYHGYRKIGENRFETNEFEVTKEYKGDGINIYTYLVIKVR